MSSCGYTSNVLCHKWPNLYRFLISDIRALWRSGLSARVPECQKLKTVGSACMAKSDSFTNCALKGQHANILLLLFFLSSSLLSHILTKIYTSFNSLKTNTTEIMKLYSNAQNVRSQFVGHYFFQQSGLVMICGVIEKHSLTCLL